MYTSATLIYARNAPIPKLAQDLGNCSCSDYAAKHCIAFETEEDQRTMRPPDRVTYRLG